MSDRPQILLDVKSCSLSQILDGLTGAGLIQFTAVREALTLKGCSCDPSVFIIARRQIGVAHNTACSTTHAGSFVTPGVESV